MATPTNPAQTGTTPCDRRKGLDAAGIEHCNSIGDGVGVDRYFIAGAREVRYWDTRTGGGAGRNVRTGNRNSSMYVLTYTPTADGGCEGTEVHPEGDPNDIDPMALLMAAGLM